MLYPQNHWNHVLVDFEEAVYSHMSCYWKLITKKAYRYFYIILIISNIYMYVHIYTSTQL